MLQLRRPDGKIIIRNALTCGLLALGLLAAVAAEAAPKVVVRAAFDIGSGTTKMTVAEIDTTSQTMVRTLCKGAMPVPYKDKLAVSGTQQFDAEIQATGLAALKELKQQAKKCKATAFAGVATAIFREAKNAPEFLQRIRKELDISIQVISQQEEALLGFNGALTASENPHREQMLVWDIGGGSMQMTAVDPSKPDPFMIYQGHLASVEFKNYIATVVQKKPLGSSPNAIDAKAGNQALRHAKKIAKQTVPKTLVAKLRQPNTTIYGIGGVHFHSIREQLFPKTEATSYTREQLTKTLNARYGMTDTQLQSDYATTQVANLILVLGFMQALGIETVQTLDVNLTQGTLTSPGYW